MNEKVKTVVIIALILMLLAIAQHFLFVQRLQNTLIAEQAEYELAGLSQDDPAGPIAEASVPDDEHRFAVLERKLTAAKILQYSFGFFAMLALLISWFFRTKKGDDHFSDMWDDDEWEDDDWQEDHA
jgi:hypothetical protein